VSSIKGYVAGLVGTTRARVDLFQADVEYRMFRLVAMIMWSIVAFLCLSIGFTFAMLTIIFGFDLPPRYAFGIPALVLLAVGAFGVIMFRFKKASKFHSTKHRDS
jgi:uncharacterized membrane protein YqjE